MEGGRRSGAAMSMALLLAVALAIQGAAAQTAPACAQKLIDCASDIGKTTPPSAACCTAIKEAVDNELPCLCSLLNNKQLIQTFGINVTQALEIPKRCKITTSTSICNTLTNSTTTAAGAPSAPPATPGKDGKSAAVARAGAPALAVLVAFWWAVVA